MLLFLETMSLSVPELQWMIFMPLFEHTTHKIESNNASIISSNKRKRSSEMNETLLWHLRLGHINLKRIERLVKDGSLEFLHVESFPTCEFCLEGKMTKRAFGAKGIRATEVLELVHTDMCDSKMIIARRGYKYFATFVDDYSGYGYIYLMLHRERSIKFL